MGFALKEHWVGVQWQSGLAQGLLVGMGSWLPAVLKGWARASCLCQ